MRKILLFILIVLSGVAYGQVPPGYTKVNAKQVYTALRADSGFHVPGYATVPNIRSNVWVGAGNIGVDTVLNRLYFYSGGSWRYSTAGSGGGLTITNKGVETSTLQGSGTLNIPKDEKVGLYITLGKTYTRFKPVVFGNSFVFAGNSWANGDYSLGTPWSTQVATYFNKTKVAIYSLGNELNYLVSANWTNARSMGVDSIAFIDLAMIPILNSATSGLPYLSTYYFGEQTPNNTRTYSYIKGTYRAYIANYYLDADWFSVSSLVDANFRDAVALDSLVTKSTTGSIGLGSFSFTKPAGKTSIVIGTYGAIGTYIKQGRIAVSRGTDTLYARDFNGLNNGNFGAAPLIIKKGLNYEAIVLPDLPTASATYTVTVTGDSARFDYVGYLIPKEQAIRPLFINNIGYGSGYNSFVIPRTTIDTANLMLQDAVADFQDYPILIQNTNNWLDSATNISLSPVPFHLSSSGNDSIAKAYEKTLISMGYAPTRSAASTGTVTSIATTSPITGGTITSTGTIACATCVVSSSPGAGIAHFAGSTQTVTSSAVDLSGSDVTGNLGVSHLNNGTSASNTTFWRGDGTWATPSGGGGSAPGNYGNVIINRNAVNSTPGSDSLDFESATGLSVKGNINTINDINIGGATDNYNLNLYGSTYAYQSFQTAGSGTGSTNGFQIGFENTGVYFLNRQNTPIFFRTNNTLRMTIGAAGEVTIPDLAGATNNRPVVASTTGVLSALTGSVATVVASADSVAISATDANVTSFTVGGSDGSFMVTAYLDITAVSAGVLTTTVTWTDVHSNSRTGTFYGMGTTTAGIGALGSSNFAPMAEIRAKAGSAITVVETLTIGTATYDISATIQQIR